MLSKAEVLKGLMIMQRFEPLLIVDEVAVGAWMLALAEVPDYDALLAGVVAWSREDTNRNVRPSNLLPYIDQVVDERKYAAQRELDEAEIKALCIEILKERGLTAAAYNASEELREEIGREANQRSWQRRVERFEIQVRT